MLLLTIWPLFALICLGYVLARAGFPSAAFWPAAERMNYFVLFPALLVANLVDAPVRDPAILRLGGAMVVTTCLAALAMTLVRSTVLKAPAARFGPALQGVVRIGNFAYPYYRLFLIGFSALVAVVLWLLLERTRFGALVRAGSESTEMVSLLGSNIFRLFSVTFALGVGLAGLAGVLSAPLRGAHRSSAQRFWGWRSWWW